MKHFHVIKATRAYTGQGYDGPTCQNADVAAPAEFETLDEALVAANKMLEANPVGWEIYDARNGVESTPVKYRVA